MTDCEASNTTTDDEHSFVGVHGLVRVLSLTDDELAVLLGEVNVRSRGRHVLVMGRVYI